MLKRFLIVSLLGLSLSAMTQAFAATSHSFGYDLARNLHTQVDDGQWNLDYQFSVGRRSALVLGLAKGDDYQVYEFGFKRYNQRYLSGTFFQLGLAYWQGDVNDSDLGVDLRLGYDLPVNTWLVFTGGVSSLYGVEQPTATGERDDYVLRPHLGIRVHF